MLPEQVEAAFAARFGRAAERVTYAPGRVNLIGEHTDYNDGFVLPMATGQRTWVAVGRGSSSRYVCCACSDNLDERCTWSPGAWDRTTAPPWMRYVAGVAELLRRRGLPLETFDLLITSELPLGGGLSSSAALTVATALGLAALCGTDVPPREIAALCRAAEHEYAGVPCGFMDQYAVLFSRAGHALLLDCRSLTFEHVPLALGDHVFVTVDSGRRHELAGGEYARRREQCGQAVEVFARRDPAVRALRDVDEAALKTCAVELPPVVAARARHVVSENRRTLAAAEALRAGDLAAFGRFMCASHASLRDDYEVSCPELDRLVDIACEVPGVLGARMTGGGFGGCIVVLVRRGAVEDLRAAVAARYDASTASRGLRVVEPGDGAAVVRS